MTTRKTQLAAQRNPIPMKTPRSHTNCRIEKQLHTKARKRLRGLLGFSNQTALAIIAIGYPLGVTGIALVYNARFRNVDQVTLMDQLERIQTAPLTEQEAITAIQNWWAVRPRVFAAPYDASAAAAAIAAGPLWDDLNKIDGPVAWLRNNNSYYTYQSTLIRQTVSFEAQPSERPSIVVSVETRDTFHGPGVYRPSSGIADFRYIFARERGTWKVWNYEKM